MKTSKLITKVSEQKMEDAHQSVKSSCWRGLHGFYGCREFDHKRENKNLPFIMKGKNLQIPCGPRGREIRMAGRKAGGTAV